MRLSLAVALASGCAFSPPPGQSTDGSPGSDGSVGSGGDGPDGAVELHDIIHVPNDQEAIGTGDLSITTAITIDTGTLDPGIALPGGVTFAAVLQDPGGPELAVLRVRNFSVTGGGSIRGIGTRPLVVIAESISLEGVIDVGSRHEASGAGGQAEAGTGIGSAGNHLQTYSDSGAGGGSHGGSGARGGHARCQTECIPDRLLSGGNAGSTYNEGLATLGGGSSGGRSWFTSQPTACERKAPGAGGGAIQLYARTTISIGATGGITAGGGGGRGGDQCNSPFNFLAGHGGGSGGAIYLQSPTVTNAGVLAANGGGGGAGGGNSGDGGDGNDGALGTGGATGGPAAGAYSARGGNGAAGATAAEVGSEGPDQGNAGGGGGGVGQIVIRYRANATAGVASPAAQSSAF
jgi:hypothetical protein